MTESRDSPGIPRFGWNHVGVARLALLLCHIAIICVSLVQIANLYSAFHYVMFDVTRVHIAAIWVAIFAVFSISFLMAPFSFGYFLGFYFYTMIASYLWLVQFSRFGYDHGIAAVSAFVSALAFLAPALFVKTGFRRLFVFSERQLDIVLHVILALAAAVVFIGASYNFRLANVSEINNLREQVRFPVPLAYAMATTYSALLPFAFACFVTRDYRWRAGAVLALLLLFYPVTLTKVTLAAPLWLLFLLLLSRFCEARISVILSLFLPALAGVVLMLLFDTNVLRQAWQVAYFGMINFRMVAVPAMALDYYNDFFAKHPITGFCQIGLLKPFVGCPYAAPLSVVMADNYHFGNVNASLFATEGVASMGTLLAPLSALACGFVIALSNHAAAGLPARFVLLSGGILIQVFLNVPLTTSLLTDGAALLFLLWYVMPRSIFGESEQQS